jgi:hypothetical protein
MWFLFYFTVLCQLLCLCNIRLVNAKEVEGSGHGLFQGCSPAFAWNDWKIQYIPGYHISLTSQSSVSFLLELSVCIIHFQLCCTLQ